MSAHDRHIKEPDTGVLSTDLFIYDAKKPGTGGLVSIVIPPSLHERETIFAKTDILQVGFILHKAPCTAQVILRKLSEPQCIDDHTFQLHSEFLNQMKASLTILFNDWKIVTLIDGEPLREIK